MREVVLPTRKMASHIAETSGSRTNCLFASKDHVRPVSKRLCIIFMACYSCPNFVLGRLKKKKKKRKKKKKMEKIAVFPLF